MKIKNKFLKSAPNLEWLNKTGFLKEVVSVIMLCAPVFIFTSGRSALLGRPRCGFLI